MTAIKEPKQKLMKERETQNEDIPSINTILSFSTHQ